MCVFVRRMYMYIVCTYVCVVYMLCLRACAVRVCMLR